MLFSLLQTVICVLLINGGLYALHLTDNVGSSSSSSSSSSTTSGITATGLTSDNSKSEIVNIRPYIHSHTPLRTETHMLDMFSGISKHIPGDGGGGVNGDSGGVGSRLNEDLADLAQLERERLMLLGLAKQTAAASTNAGAGHHGRPIITGRIQMTPAEEMDSDYSPLLVQQAKNYMFGNVLKHPSLAQNDVDYEDKYNKFVGSSSSDHGGYPTRQQRPSKFDYGNVVQLSERERHQHPHNEQEPYNLDLDAYMELDVEPDLEEIPDVDGYQYLDELLEEQRKNLDEVGFMTTGNNNGLHIQNPYSNDQSQHFDAKAMNAGLHTLFQQQHQQYEAPKNLLLQQKLKRKQVQNRKRKDILNAQHQYSNEGRLRKLFVDRQQLNAALQKHGFNVPLSELTTAHIETVNIKKQKQQQSNGKATEPTEDSLVAALPIADTSNTSSNKKLAHNNAIKNADKKLNTSPSSLTSSVGSSIGRATPRHVVETQEEELFSPNLKRSSPATASSGNIGSSSGYGGNLQSPVPSHSIASQLMLRTARGQRQYDVPQIECPTAMDGMERFACPTPDLQGRYRCIDDHVLCDGFIDCPEGEDEDRRSCMFYKTTKAHLDVLADALLRWARGR